MNRLAIIGGTGLTSLNGLTITHKEMIRTPFGEPSGPLTYGTFCGHEVVFFARHGYGHTIPPHKVNYRANIWAMKHAEVSHVIAVAAVGGITDDLKPGMLVIPHQIIDYTWGRQHTYFEEDLAHVTHIDFTEPYCDELRTMICEGADATNVATVNKGVYAAVQGPRLETAAEIDRLERDGCTIVGMTGMPEAALARELELCYAAISVVANKAAGRGDGKITLEEIRSTLASAMMQVREVIDSTIERLVDET
jgi:5'-methylthioinosine phosphorylase